MNRRQFQLTGLAALLAGPPAILDGPLLKPIRQQSVDGWTQWAGPDRNFSFAGLKNVSELPKPELGWQRELGKGHSAVVADASHCYTMHLEGDQEVITKWRLSDGERIWDYRYDVGYHASIKIYDGPHSTPLLRDNQLIATAIDAQVHAIDIASGKRNWQQDLRKTCGVRLPQSGYASSPLDWDDYVILPTIGESQQTETERYDPDPKPASGRSTVPGAVALNIRTGKEAWRTELFRSSHASAIGVNIDGQPMVVIHGMFELIGLDPASGKILWRQVLRKTAADNVSFTPIWDPNRKQFLVCHGYCNSGAQAIGIENNNGRWQTRVNWTNSRMRIVHTNAVLSGSTLVGTNREPGTLLVGIDVRKGTSLLRKRGFGKSNLLVSDSQLLILDESGELFYGLLENNELKERWRIQALDKPSWTVPSVSGESLLLRDEKHLSVYRFN